MFPCVGLKQKVFAWGGTVISAVLLHIYSCTFSVGHLVLLNDVKLWLMQADAWLSAVNEKLLCDDEQRTTCTQHAQCKHKDTQWLKPSVNHLLFLFDLNAFNLLWLCIEPYLVSANFPVGVSTHTYIGVVNKICFALVSSDRGYL